MLIVNIFFTFSFLLELIRSLYGLFVLIEKRNKGVILMIIIKFLSLGEFSSILFFMKVFKLSLGK